MAKKAVDTQVRESRAPRYELAELKAHAKELFEVRAEVLEGAMYGADGELFTVPEVQEKIKQFMKAKVV